MTQWKKFAPSIVIGLWALLALAGCTWVVPMLVVLGLAICGCVHERWVLR